MSANLKAPFDPSCCEGTYCNENSTQYCGCDKGANWMCAYHKVKKLMEDELERLQGKMDEEVYGTRKV